MYKNVEKELFFLVSNKLNWLEANTYFIGREFTDLYNTLMNSLPKGEKQSNLVRELIFEEVRQKYFPQQISRYKAAQVISAEKESLSFWLPKLSVPGAKIYKLELTGKLHRGNQELLQTSTLSAQNMKHFAYHYWLGNNNSKDECIFEGFANVIEIIGANNLSDKS